MAMGRNAANGDDAEVWKIMWNGRIKGLVKGLDREIALDMLRIGALRWRNRQLNIIFGVFMGMRLTDWRKLKG